MKLGIVALACIAILGIGCSESKETRMQRFLAQGNDMMTRQNYNEAINFYEGALKLDSCFKEALNNLGTVYYKQGDYQRSQRLYTKAIECHPDFIPAYINRSNSFYQLRLFNKAMEDLEYVRSEKPDTVIVHYLLGLVYTDLREYASAKLSFRKALSIDPSNSELLTNLGVVHYYEKDFDSAMLYLDKATSTGEVEPNALNAVALIEIERGDYQKALSWINRAIELQPKNAYYRNNRGYIYLMQGELEKALTDIDESIMEDPDNGWAYRNKGIYHLRMNQAQEAVRVLKLAEKKDEEIEDLYYYLAEAAWQSGDRSQACVYYASALKREEVAPDVVKKRCP